ncbi:MAG: hypothetical protein WBC31_03050, partial [Candidatus Phosphoribacter baldrii]
MLATTPTRTTAASDLVDPRNPRHAGSVSGRHTDSVCRPFQSASWTTTGAWSDAPVPLRSSRS